MKTEAEAIEKIYNRTYFLGFEIVDILIMLSLVSILAYAFTYDRLCRDKLEFRYSSRPSELTSLQFVFEDLPRLIGLLLCILFAYRIWHSDILFFFRASWIFGGGISGLFVAQLIIGFGYGRLDELRPVLKGWLVFCTIMIAASLLMKYT